jgi:hypothetical protein
MAEDGATRVPLPNGLPGNPAYPPGSTTRAGAEEVSEATALLNFGVAEVVKASSPASRSPLSAQEGIRKSAHGAGALSGCPARPGESTSSVSRSRGPLGVNRTARVACSRQGGALPS